VGHHAVLGIGAHPDDIELGCGATLLAHRRRGDRVAMLVMTTGEQDHQAATSRLREQEEAAALLGAELFWGGFVDGAVPVGTAAVRAIDDVLTATGADVIYTHAPDDTHQDHRATAIASLAAGRRTIRILCYESATSRRFAPSLYVDVGGFVEGKLDLARAHLSQVLKNGLVDLEALEGLARARGLEARVHQAEAFETARFVWPLGRRTLEQEAMDRELDEVGR
jgi:LmbE family N-acetylglucosaminyl deacetylase